jgi:hypothetical protein
LVLSELGYVEIGTLDDRRHALAAERFLDAALPRVFFVRFDPFAVMKQEIDLFNAGDRSAPEGDVPMLQRFAAASIRQLRLTFSGVLTGVHDRRVVMRGHLHGMADSFIAGIEALRQRIDSEPEMHRQYVNGLADAKGLRSTRGILRAFVGDLQADRKNPISRNDAIDVLQAVVPGSCCDFVVLDKSWCARLRNTADRLQRAGVDARVARAFRVSELSELIDVLEAFQAVAVNRAA